MNIKRRNVLSLLMILALIFGPVFASASGGKNSLGLAPHHQMDGVSIAISVMTVESGNSLDSDQEKTDSSQVSNGCSSCDNCSQSCDPGLNRYSSLGTTSVGHEPIQISSIPRFYSNSLKRPPRF